MRGELSNGAAPTPGSSEWKRRRSEFNEAVPRLLPITRDYEGIPEAHGRLQTPYLPLDSSARESRQAKSARGAEPLEYSWATAELPRLDRAYLVKGVLAPSSLAVIYGDANSGKTYFTLGLAVDLAAGRSWRDRKVRKGLVVYIAGEGVEGFQYRIAAHRLRERMVTDSPLAIVSRAVNFLETNGDVEDLIALVAAAESECGEKCVLIVVDTLSRAMAGADENSAEGMTLVIANADRIRRETGATVAFIHHSGKDATRGARGHSSLRAAVDTEILIEGQGGVRTATVVKQRELQSGQVFAFKLEVVTLGTDADGDPVTACVVSHLEDVAIPRRSGGKNQEKARTALREWCRTNVSDQIAEADLTAILEAQGIQRKRRPEVLKWLAIAGALTPSAVGYRVNRIAL